MKFSIITPVYNGEKYIAKTIESILSQKGDFEIEYIITDGASTDKTIQIIKSYVNLVNKGRYPLHCKKIMIRWFSEKDNGMYDAIEKGFAHSTGEVMAYINADDIYLPQAFATVAEIFVQYPDIEWVKGINTTSNETGEIITQGSCFLYRQNWLQKGIYGRNAYFVQQDSVFWKRSLWDKTHPHISSFRLAGDYALWITFAKHVPLWSFNKPVSIFRRHPGQLSSSMEAYRNEQEKIAPHNFLFEKRVVLFFSLRRFLKLAPKGTVTQALFFILFPSHKQQWYIDFAANGNPIKKKAVSYLV